MKRCSGPRVGLRDGRRRISRCMKLAGIHSLTFDRIQAKPHCQNPSTDEPLLFSETCQRTPCTSHNKLPVSTSHSCMQSAETELKVKSETWGDACPKIGQEPVSTRKYGHQYPQVGKVTPLPRWARHTVIHTGKVATEASNTRNARWTKWLKKRKRIDWYQVVSTLGNE
jgi:hypothetical protein